MRAAMPIWIQSVVRDLVAQIHEAGVVDGDPPATLRSGAQPKLCAPSTPERSLEPPRSNNRNFWNRRVIADAGLRGIANSPAVSHGDRSTGDGYAESLVIGTASDSIGAGEQQ
jgi:hypothetical protein